MKPHANLCVWCKQRAPVACLYCRDCRWLCAQCIGGAR